MLQVRLIICHAVRANRQLLEAVGCVPNRVLTIYLVAEIHIFHFLLYSRGLEEYHKEVDEDHKKFSHGMLGASPSFSSECRFYIMYHGTTWDNALKIQAGGFIPSVGGMLGPGVYLSRDIRKASRYPLYNRTQKLAVLRVFTGVGRVKKIDYQGHPLQKTWHQHGFDTAWVPPNCGMVASGLEEDCVYEPWRITVLQILPN